MRLKQREPFADGYNSITELKGKHSDMLMDFGILELVQGEGYQDDAQLEKVIILLSGEIEVKFQDEMVKVKRDNCFDDNLWCLNTDRNTSYEIRGIGEKSEIAVVRTENEKTFPAAIYDKGTITNEVRGKDTMLDAGRRIVRTAMDVRLTPHSNLMFGEDVHIPGRWAGFPSHHHRQPEIYFYKFWPEDGFGLLRHGDEAILLEQNDTVKIMPNHVHPQVAAPGYAMYFLWIIRHLPGDPYIKPTFEEKYLWTEKPDARYWPDNI